MHQLFSMTVTQHNNIRKRLIPICFLFILCMIFSCGDHRYPQQLLTADSLTEVNPDSAVSLLRQLSPQMQDERKAVRMYHRLLTVKAADKADQLQPVPDSILPLVKYYESWSGDKRLLPTAYYYAGRTYYELHDAPQALDYFQKAADVLENDWELKGCIYSNIGYIFLYQGMYDEMKEAFTMMYEVSKQANDTLSMIYGLRDISIALEAEDRHEEALSYLENAYHLAKQSNFLSMIWDLEMALSRQYLFMGDYEKARRYAQNLSDHINYVDQSALYSLIASIHKHMGNEDSLLYYSKILEQVGHIHAKDSAYKFMTKIYLHRGDINKANEYFHKYLLMDDSIRKITRTESTAKVYSLFNYQLREKENISLKHRNQNKRFVIIIIGVMSVLIITILLTYLYRLRRKHEEETLKLQYAEHLKDKKLQESQRLAESNEDKIALLERQLEWERQKLFSSDSLSHITPVNTDDKDTLISNSPIYQKLMEMGENGSSSHPTDEDWYQLEKLLSTMYDSFPLRLKIVCKLTKRDYRMCMLIKIKMPYQKIANIFSIEKSSVASQRARLYRDHFGKKGSARDWDEYIWSF